MVIEDGFQCDGLWIHRLSFMVLCDKLVINSTGYCLFLRPESS